MPVPAQATYTLSALVAANTSFLTLIDAENGNPIVKIYDVADVLLAQVQMTDPAGTVAPATGQVTFTFTGASPNALASGAAAYGEVCDANGVSHLALPAAPGVAAASGFLVMNTLNLVIGEPVSISSATVG